MLAQDAPSSSASDVVAGFIFLAILALQIYLVYAIIATRHDVRAIRTLLRGGNDPRWQAPPHSGTGWNRGVAVPVPVPPPPVGQIAHQTAVYEVILLEPGPDPQGLREVLEFRLNYDQMDAAMLVVTPGARIFRTRDQGQASFLVEEIRGAGGIAQIRGMPGEAQAVEHDPKPSS
jgi:hypothetical protein